MIKKNYFIIISAIILSFSSFINAQSSITPDEKIIYKKTREANLLLHAFYPNEYKSNKKYPVIIFFFGGGWNSENKNQFYRQAKYFSTKEMISFCADYRVKSNHNVTPDVCVMDAKSAIRYIRINSNKFNINTNQIIASGGSAGGHLAVSTALLPSFNDDSDNIKVSCIPNALVLFNPVLDTSKMHRLGKFSLKLSPIHNIKKGAPKTLIMHGTKDELVSHYQAIEFYKKMIEIGNECELELYKDMPHGFFNSKKYNETLKRTEQFIKSLGWIY